MFALCDEAYALMASKDPRSLTSAHVLCTEVGLHGSWALGALCGSLLFRHWVAGRSRTVQEREEAGQA